MKSRHRLTAAFSNGQVSVVNQVVVNDLGGSVADIVHSLCPFHTILGFELFRHALIFGKLFYQPGKHSLGFLVQIGKVGVQPATCQKLGIESDANFYTSPSYSPSPAWCCVHLLLLRGNYCLLRGLQWDHGAPPYPHDGLLQKSLMCSTYKKKGKGVCHQFHLSEPDAQLIETDRDAQACFQQSWDWESRLFLWPWIWPGGYFWKLQIQPVFRTWREPACGI